MDEESKYPPFNIPWLQQDLRTIASLGGLQEIARTFREVMEKNDKAADELFESRDLKDALKVAQEHGPGPISERWVHGESAMKVLRSHLIRIIAYFS